MNHAQSSSCETAGEGAQIGKQDPGGSAGDRGLEVFSQAPAAAEPGKRALDHPPAGQQLEAFDAGRALDNLDRPGTAISNRGKQLLAAVDAIGEDMPKPGKALPQRAQQRHRAMRILDVGWM